MKFRDFDLTGKADVSLFLFFFLSLSLSLSLFHCVLIKDIPWLIDMPVSISRPH